MRKAISTPKWKKRGLSSWIYPSLGRLQGNRVPLPADTTSRHTLSWVHRRHGEPVRSSKPYGDHGKTFVARHLKMVEFTIVDISEGAYNGIIRRLALSQFGDVLFLIHLKMKFLM
ncbi:hypothetical protein LIER_36265 [Lithospermum erythrorhizon]|uniref:Uncharacterized protein n=1 Tax=Lithospermum erythrorhizon TaxID=34254 RepID=A0AAV3P843_LITER